MKNPYKNSKWNDVLILEELKILINKYRRFPSYTEIKEEGNALLSGIYVCGDLTKYKLLLGYEKKRCHTNGIQQNRIQNLLGHRRKPKWNTDIITEQLIKVISDIKHYPKQKELVSIDSKLASAVMRYGGLNKFRNICGYKLPIHKDNYWNKYTIVHRLYTIVLLYKHFPTHHELEKIDKTLAGAINGLEGINYYRNIFKCPLIKESNGHWTRERILCEINEFVEKTGYFPSASEIPDKLVSAVTRVGGLIRLQREMGYEPNYRSANAAYVSNRGRKTEMLLLDILKDYCNQKNLSQPIINKRFKNNKTIEFVCETNKTIGIDVTNTKTHDVIRRKWLDNKYHPYLDELIIVVFSNKFYEEDYEKFNKESPDNVYITSIDDFLKTLEHTLKEDIKQKVEIYKSCTFGKRNK